METGGSRTSGLVMSSSFLPCASEKAHDTGTESGEKGGGGDVVGERAGE